MRWLGILVGILAVFLVGAKSYPLVVNWLDQPQQHQLQTKLLSDSFSQVQPRSNGVFFALNPKTEWIDNINGDLAKKSFVLKIGEVMTARDEHTKVKYTVAQVASDGVEIFYQAKGEAPSRVRFSNGTVKLPWK